VTYDLVVRGAEVVTPLGVSRLDVAIESGRFVALGEFCGDARETLDASGLLVFPGILDAHVHFNEPGRTAWEGLASGSRALAAGGGTAFFDMPLNSTPPVLDAATFAEKRRLAEAKSCLDFALWGGLTPHNLDRMEELAAAGAIGVKAFLCASGIDDFEAITDAETLRLGLRAARRAGLLVAVHAEDDELARRHTERVRSSGARDAAAWLASRPVEVEVAAIERACVLAGEEGARLHVVHVSSPEGLAAIAAAKRRGVDVSAETCPHYLLLQSDDVEEIGAAGKCAPPVRDEANREALWGALDRLDTIGSDHSPGPPELKTGEDFFAIWGGISGCQHGFPLLLSEALARDEERRDEALGRFGHLLATGVAERFGLSGKGAIVEGNDADFALLDVDAPHELDNTELLYRHRQGPYAGRRSTVRVVETRVRGVRVAESRGRLLRPHSPARRP
jgi:allantoinase